MPEIVNEYKLEVGIRFPRLYKRRLGAHFGDARVIGSSGELAPVALAAIIDAACRVTHISRDHLLGPRRAREYAWPRQIVMYIAREKCPHLSLPTIGRLLGNRDHTTILHGIRACRCRIQDNPEFRQLYEDILGDVGVI